GGEPLPRRGGGPSAPGGPALDRPLEPGAGRPRHRRGGRPAAGRLPPPGRRVDAGLRRPGGAPEGRQGSAGHRRAAGRARPAGERRHPPRRRGRRRRRRGGDARRRSGPRRPGPGRIPGPVARPRGGTGRSRSRPRPRADLPGPAGTGAAGRGAGGSHRPGREGPPPRWGRRTGPQGGHGPDPQQPAADRGAPPRARRPPGRDHHHRDLVQLHPRPAGPLDVLRTSTARYIRCSGGVAPFGRDGVSVVHSKGDTTWPEWRSGISRAPTTSEAPSGPPSRSSRSARVRSAGSPSSRAGAGRSASSRWSGPTRARSSMSATSCRAVSASATTTGRPETSPPGRCTRSPPATTPGSWAMNRPSSSSSRAPPPSPRTEPDMTVDGQKLEAFVNQAIGDLGAAISACLIHVGDKLGLYRAMAGAGPLTPGGLAARTATAEPYVREWLNNQAAGGYVRYDPATGRYELPPEQAACLADEDSPAFVVGGFECVAAAFTDEPRITEAFRTGAGVSWHEHDARLFSGTERLYRPGYQANLVESWLPALDGVTDKLAAGATVADVGCGHGASTIVMARAFPASRFVGFDCHDASVA